MNSTRLMAAIFTISVLLGTAEAAENAPSDLPNDVVAFVGRRSSCAEWTAKAQSHQKSPDIGKILASLQCDDVVRDEATLREKYQSDPAVLAALDANWVRVVKRVPVRRD